MGAWTLPSLRTTSGSSWRCWSGTLHAPRPRPRELPERLSGREHEVLQLLAAGKSNRRIAADLFVSVGTVKTHLNNLYRKLGARSRTQAVARARDLNLI